MYGTIVNCCFSRAKKTDYKIYLKKKTSISKDKYHKLRNYFFPMTNQKKKKHMQNQFQKHRKNFRKSWWLMKNLLGKVRDKFSSTSISYNNTIINKPVEIANCFNGHFSIIAKKLYDKLPHLQLNLLTIYHRQTSSMPFTSDGIQNFKNRLSFVSFLLTTGSLISFSN